MYKRQAHGCVQEGATPLVYDSLALLDFPDCPPFAGPIVEDTEAIALLGDLASLMQEPIIDEARACQDAGATGLVDYLLIVPAGFEEDVYKRQPWGRASFWL